MQGEIKGSDVVTPKVQDWVACAGPGMAERSGHMATAVQWVWVRMWSLEFSSGVMSQCMQGAADEGWRQLKLQGLHLHAPAGALNGWRQAGGARPAGRARQPGSPLAALPNPLKHGHKACFPTYSGPERVTGYACGDSSSLTGCRGGTEAGAAAAAAAAAGAPGGSQASVGTHRVANSRAHANTARMRQGPDPWGAKGGLGWVGCKPAAGRPSVGVAFGF